MISRTEESGFDPALEHALESSIFPEPSQSSGVQAQLVAIGAAVLGVGVMIAVAA
ncbi:MAG: hypothetical protein HC929_18975 [Leptolyngbyaceae cyanobacterium SM2_5_2]|nr:hypothetical protein [Leptolyngbyaceae cyanobacterium SM2_5_2]